MTTAPSSENHTGQAENPSALPLGTRLDEFELRGVLGVGGFGIVYLAFDHALEREVAVKEYMPASLAGRTETLQVSLRSKGDADNFQLGLKSFINEAKMLARFDHPALLKVHRFWQANGTAYMAMPVLRGQTLKELRARMAAPPDEAWLRSLLEPLLGAIHTLHEQGVYHRDIAPDNINIDAEGRPVLLDFGAARRVLSDRTQTLTAILKPAYAPIEQYAEAGAVRQGPWTDLYALGATLHYLLMGHPPAPATARTVHDEASELTAERLPHCSDDFLRIIDWMLAPRPADRPQQVGEVLDALAGRLQAPPRRIPESHTQWDRTVVLPHDLRQSATAPPDDAVRAAAMRLEGPLEGDTPTRVLPAGRPVAQPESMGSLVVPVPVSAQSRLQPAPPPGAPEPGAAGTEPPGAATLAVLPGPVVAPDAAPTVLPGAGPAPGPAAAVARADPPAAAPRATHAGRRLLPLGLLAAVAIGGAAAAALWWPAGDAPSLPGAAAVVEPTAVAPLVGPQPEAAAVPPPSEAASAAVPAPPMVAESAIATVVVPARAAPPPAATPPARAPVQRPLPGAEPKTQPAAAASALTVAAPSSAEPTASAALPPQPAPPASEPAAPPPARALGPEAQCAGGNLFTHLICMERQCLQSANQSHPDCLAWRKDAKRD